MNTINIAIDFTNGTNRVSGISLITGDYASTKIVFSFDREDGTKVFELKNPSGVTRYVGEIVNNEVVLTGVDDGNNYSIFNESGLYIYEVSLYVDDSKLTSAKGQLPVKQEQVIVGDETIEPYLPIFDELMQQINTAITETNNLNITAEKVDHTTTIEITNKDGETETIEILDGEKGDKGDKGDAGAIKMEIVNPLPQTGNEDTIYLVPITKIQVETLPETGLPDTIYIVNSTGKRYVYKNNQWEEETENNNFNEYIWVSNDWEPLGGINTEIDLTDYVKFTDYATAQTGGVVKAVASMGYGVSSTGVLQSQIANYSNYESASNYYNISKGTLENVISGKGLVSNTDYATSSVGGVIKSGYGLEINGENKTTATTWGYDTYQGLGNNNFIGKGTLENVITGKGLVSNTDYASDSVAGVIKTNWGSGTYMSNGALVSRVADYNTYQQLGSSAFISKGTLENVFTGKNFISVVVLTETEYNDLTEYAENTEYHIIEG